MAWYDIISEELKRTFYSDREAKVEISRNKSLSTTTPTILTQEPDLVLTDASHQYTIGTAIDSILTARNQLIKQWRNSTALPEVDEAIQEIINETLVFDEDEEIPIELDLEALEIPDSLQDKITESYEKILRLLDFKKRGIDLFRQWYVDGVLNVEVVYDNARRSEGIKKIILLNPFDFFKVKDVDSGKVEYFYSNRLSSDLYNRPNFNLLQLSQQAPMELKYKDEQITQVVSGVHSIDKLFSVSYLNKAMKVINQVSLIEDSIIIYRITRAPEKKAFYIDTGRLPKGKAEQYLTTMMNRHRNKLVYNTTDGTVENRKKSISLHEDYWLTRSAEGKGTQIETIQGTGQDLRDIADLDYFYDKMYRALNVPATRRQKQESRLVGMNHTNIDVEREELKFFKFILRLRARFSELFRDLLKKELIAAKIVSVDDWNKIREKIRFKYSNVNEYAEMKKLMVFESRMTIAALAADLLEQKLISKEWVRKEVLNQSDDDIKEIDKQLEDEREAAEENGENPFGDEEGGDGGGNSPPFGGPPKKDNGNGEENDENDGGRRTGDNSPNGNGKKKNDDKKDK